jgi:hypothetical protein
MEDGETYTTLNTGKYSFRIKRNIQSYNNSILMHTYTVGGNYEKCVSVSYDYKDNVPIGANIPYLLYEPECSLDSSLEQGGGSEIVVKTLLRYTYKEIPSVSIFKFDDMSKIDCIPRNMAKQPPRKVEKPLNLAFFSIAYHSKTWYELRFNAEMVDKELYAKYKERLTFLTDPQQKPEFKRFLEIAKPPLEQIPQLESYYSSAETYREFFNVIPKHIRCHILYPWLSTFMKFYINDVYRETNWEINMNTINRNLSRGGYRKQSKKNSTRKNSLTYRIYHKEDIQQSL